MLALGRLSDARDSAAAAQRHAPPDGAVLNSVGGLFNLAGDQERSLVAYDRAVGSAPDHAEALFNRAAVRAIHSRSASPCSRRFSRPNIHFFTTLRKFTVITWPIAP